MNKKIFITGASGFIGRNLVNRLAAEGDKVYALTREPFEHTDKRVINIVGDIMEPESFIDHLKGCDVIYHCAAYISFLKKDLQKALEINVHGTANILESALSAGVKKVVYLSAGAVLGFSSDNDRAIDETADPDIKEDNVYAFSKKLAENEVQKYVRKGLDVSIANIATVYGQGDRKLNSGSIIKTIYEGRMKVTPPGGTSFVSIDDLVDGLILLSEKGRPGERYIFCTENMDYKTLALKIARTLGVKGPCLSLPRISYYPALLAVKGIELLSGLKNDKVNLVTTQILKETYGYKYYSSEKAREELGWRPSQGLEEAVNKAFDYYKENKLII